MNILNRKQRMKKFKVQFVEFIPANIKEGILYITMQYKTARHLCPCGCRGLVITPLKPAHWQLYFDGDSVSLFPSIRNRSFECKSHYWIQKNKVYFTDDDDDFLVE